MLQVAAIKTVVVPREQKFGNIVSMTVLKKKIANSYIVEEYPKDSLKNLKMV